MICFRGDQLIGFIHRVLLVGWLLKDFGWMTTNIFLAFPFGIVSIVFHSIILYIDFRQPFIFYNTSLLLWVIGNFIWMTIELGCNTPSSGVHVGPPVPIGGISPELATRLTKIKNGLFLVSSCLQFIMYLCMFYRLIPIPEDDEHDDEANQLIKADIRNLYYALFRRRRGTHERLSDQSSHHNQASITSIYSFDDISTTSSLVINPLSSISATNKKKTKRTKKQQKQTRNIEEEEGEAEGEEGEMTDTTSASTKDIEEGRRKVTLTDPNEEQEEEDEEEEDKDEMIEISFHHHSPKSRNSLYTHQPLAQTDELEDSPSSHDQEEENIGMDLSLTHPTIVSDSTATSPNTSSTTSTSSTSSTTSTTTSAAPPPTLTWSILFIENMYIFFWISKDLFWSWGTGDFLMELPRSLIIAFEIIAMIFGSLAIYSTSIVAYGYYTHNTIKYLDAITTICWICANYLWMSGEFFLRYDHLVYDDATQGNDTITRVFSMIMFLTGLAIQWYLAIYFFMLMKRPLSNEEVAGGNNEEGEGVEGEEGVVVVSDRKHSPVHKRRGNHTKSKNLSSSSSPRHSHSPSRSKSRSRSRSRDRNGWERVRSDSIVSDHSEVEEVEIAEEEEERGIELQSMSSKKKKMMNTTTSSSSLSLSPRKAYDTSSISASTATSSATAMFIREVVDDIEDKKVLVGGSTAASSNNTTSKSSHEDDDHLDFLHYS